MTGFASQPSTVSLRLLWRQGWGQGTRQELNVCNAAVLSQVRIQGTSAWMNIMHEYHHHYCHYYHTPLKRNRRERPVGNTANYSFDRLLCVGVRCYCYYYYHHHYYYYYYSEYHAMLQVTTNNQATGVMGKEPMRTLGKIRRGKQLGWTLQPKWKPAAFFGWK